MRRLTAAMAASLLAAATVAGTAGVAGPAVAQPSETPEAPPAEQPAAAEPVPGEEVCAIADQRLVELSGLVALEDGYAVLNDGTDLADREGVFFLDGQCQVTEQITYPTPPLDPEDLALDREANVLWIGDVGDNFETSGNDPRATVALWRVDLGGDRTPQIHRFTYPDDQPRDAEALLLTGDGTPIIVSKGLGVGELFVPEELRPSTAPDDTVALTAAGEFAPQDTGAEHSLGAVATQLVTGGANAPDNSTVVLRTYTDAYEFDVADGDVVAAITEGEPRITPLPDEPLGEAISYSADGERFVTVSEVPPDAEFTPAVLSYAPAAPPAPEEGGGEQAAPAAEDDGGGSLFNNVQDIINVIAIVGVVGLLLVAAGVFGIVMARRRAASGGKGKGKGKGAAGGRVPAGPVTGRARLSGEPPDPLGAQPTGVYTSQTARQQQPGPEYGEYGPEYRGTEYGGGGDYGQGGDYGHRGDPYRGGYREQPYDREQDQGWSNGHRGQPPPTPPAHGHGPGYQAQGGGPGYGEHQGYADPGYGYQGPPPGYQQVAPPPPANGGYQPGGGYGGPPDGYQGHDGYQGNGAPDGYQDNGYRGEDYSDDPDYRYEFRQRPGGRW